MRKLVLTTLLLVLVGAVAAAWLSSSTPSGSAIGDINLAGGRTPGSGTMGFGVPPRQNPTAPARSLFTARGAARAASPESALPAPELTAASSGQHVAYGARNTLRRALAPGASDSSGTRTGRQARNPSSSRGPSGLGLGAGGAGGGGGRVASQDAAAGEKTTTARTQAPAAQRTPAAAPPSRDGGGNRSGSPSSGGGGSAAPPAAVAPAVGGVAIAPGLAGPAPALSVVPPFSPGASPSASPTPEPTTMLLLGTGIAGLYRMRRYLE
jgi:hypothetical protein